VNLFSDVVPAVAVAVQPPEHRELSTLAPRAPRGSAPSFRRTSCVAGPRPRCLPLSPI
jgi:hypothetical protein